MAATYFITCFYSKLSFGVHRTKIYIYMNAAARRCFCTSLPVNTTLSHNDTTEQKHAMVGTFCVHTKQTQFGRKTQKWENVWTFQFAGSVWLLYQYKSLILSQKNSSALNLSAKWYSHVHSLPKKCRKRLENDIISNVYFSISVLPHMGVRNTMIHLIKLTSPDLKMGTHNHVFTTLKMSQ